MKCLNCNVYLPDGVIIDHDFLDERAIVTLRATCHICGKKYKWCEYYSYDEADDLEEIQ